MTTLDSIRDIASAHFDIPVHCLTADTSIDTINHGDELTIIEFFGKVETQCGCSFPDFELQVLTLHQVALLADKYKVKNKDMVHERD